MTRHPANGLVFASILALLLGVGACSDTSDPAGNGDEDTGGTRDLGGGNDTDEDTTPDTGGDDLGDDAVADVGEDDQGGDDQGVDDQGGGDTGPFVCGEDPFYLGQVFVPDEPDPLSPDGGVPRFEPYDSSYDAGMAAILAAAPSTSGETANVDLTITDATVVATSFNTANTQRANRIFWLADSNGTMEVFFLSAEAPDRQPPFSVKVGQRISVDVTELENFSGTTQIRNVDQESWVLESADNEVYIDERADEAITIDDLHTVVRVTGRVGNETTECPDAETLCYVMTYGESENTVELRSSTDFLEGGDCVTYIGPVAQFGGNPQLNTDNFDWMWIYDE